MAAAGLKSVDIASEGAFLGVERSARGFRWVERLAPGEVNVAGAIAQSFGLPELLARVMTARGARSASVEGYLNPTIKALMPDPIGLQDMERAATRIAAAIRESEPIAIFGDYDVDGAASAALLSRFLVAHGITPTIYIPDRLIEGYGPNIAAFEGLIEGEGARLIITVDCGTTSHGAIERARELGADVIVIDHHLTDEILPQAYAVINPNRQDDLSGLGALAAAGVTFMTIVAVARQLRCDDWYGGAERTTPDLREWLDLVALATVCDVVPLRGLNRAFVAKGLTVMRQRKNLGIRALCDTAGLTSPPTPYHLGFVLGPRINAGGRIGDASLGARLLTSADGLEAAEIAGTLERLNYERKIAETGALEEALVEAERVMADNLDCPVLIVAGDRWHRGIIGLIASRLVERFTRPVAAVTWEGGDVGTGSARSIPVIDIGAAIKRALNSGLLMKGGGHAMAAGFTLERRSFDAFSRAMGDWLSRPANAAADKPELAMDGALMAASATPELMALLDRAGPFGSGNPEPRFVLPAHRCVGLKLVGNAHLRATVQAVSGSRIGAIAFRAADTDLGTFLQNQAGNPIHLAGHLRRDHWGGKEKLDFVIEDAADPREAQI